jgi:IS30 family transposase
MVNDPHWTGPTVSHERIYQHIWQNKQEGGNLYKHLRIAGTKQKRKRRNSKDLRGIIPNRVGIEKRPHVVGLKKRIGDWEGDTIIGAHHKGALVTLVERKSKLTLLGQVRRPTAEAVKETIIRLLRRDQKRVLTLTVDNGKEFTEHQAVAKALKAKVYFADPYSAWQRGLNENTNGLIRQYFPKGTDLRQVTHEKLNRVMERLNQRPRKTLGYLTPNEVYYENKRIK